MQKMAEFSKVNYKQFRKDWLDTFFEDENDYIDPVTKMVKLEVDNHIRNIYEGIQLPKRATKQSAGHDFYSPVSFTLKPGKSIKIPTGIRCEMYDGWVLTIYPRSGHGFKYGMHMANTVCVIDGDYFESDNQGHIFVKLVNDSVLAQDIRIEAGDGFCQGIFLPFGITRSDNVTTQRNGGFGSTGR